MTSIVDNGRLWRTLFSKCSNMLEIWNFRLQRGWLNFVLT